MSESSDTAFIGAGHNCLAAALHLTASGWKVAVFEQAAVVRGAVKSGAHTLPGFQHDWAAMNLSLFAGSPFMKVYGAELRQHGLEFAPVSNPFASAFPDGTWCGVSTDAPATRRRIARHSDTDAATWDRLCASFPTEAPHFFGLLGTRIKLRAIAYFVFKALRVKGLSGTLDIGQFLLQSPRQ